MNIVSKYQVLSSYGLDVKLFQRFWTKGWPTQLINESINDKGVCGTPPATWGLSNITDHSFVMNIFIIICYVRSFKVKILLDHFEPYNIKKMSVKYNIKKMSGKYSKY